MKCLTSGVMAAANHGMICGDRKRQKHVNFVKNMVKRFNLWPSLGLKLVSVNIYSELNSGLDSCHRRR